MKKNKIIVIAALAIVLTAISLSIFFNKKNDSPTSRTEFALDTVCTITLYEFVGDENEILDKAFDLCFHYEQMLSTTISNSDIYKINHSNGKPTTINQETADLISDSLKYCKMSNGLFDITILPVKNLWDFSGNSNDIPNGNKLSETLKYVDYTKISIEGCVVTIPKGMGIDLGAIAKGFVADRMADFLRKNNVSSALIDLGGNIYAIGKKPDDSNWRVGIQKPFSKNGEQSDVVEISDASAVTSGIYQRYFSRDDKIYHHILNAKTGMPCDTKLYSVTVISSSSQECDALSTVCMLIGYEKSVELLKKFPDTNAVFITSDYKVLRFNS